MNRPNLRTRTTALSALIVPITLLVSTVTGAYYKSSNPQNIDITQGLAYLQQTMTAAVITFSLIALFIVIGIVKMYRRDRNFSDAKLPLVLFSATIVLLIATGITNAYTNSVQDQYLRDQGRPTLQEFFDKK